MILSYAETRLSNAPFWTHLVKLISQPPIDHVQSWLCFVQTPHVAINGAQPPEMISQHGNADTKAVVQESETVPRKCHSPKCMIMFSIFKNIKLQSRTAVTFRAQCVTSCSASTVIRCSPLYNHISDEPVQFLSQKSKFLVRPWHKRIMPRYSKHC